MEEKAIDIYYFVVFLDSRKILLSWWSLQRMQCQFSDIVLLGVTNVVARSQVEGAIDGITLIGHFIREAICKEIERLSLKNFSYKLRKL